MRLIGTVSWSAADRRAVGYMANGGELFIYIGNGDLCTKPLPVGSGAIAGDDGLVHVSRLTVRRLRQLGLTRKEPHRLLPERQPWAALIADGHSIDLPE